MNEFSFNLYRFFSHLVPVYPVYLLLFASKGLSIARISLLLIIWSGSALVFEVPTGILADRWSRKHLIVAGRLLEGGCYALWLLADGFALFAAGFILWGLGGALCSGTEEALLYDSLKLCGREDSFDRILGRSVFYGKIGVAVSGVTGGIIAMRSMELALVLSAASMLFCAGIAMLFREVNSYSDRHTKAEHQLFKQYFDTLKEGLRLCIGRKQLLLLILFSTTVICTAGVLDEYDQLVAAWLGLNTALVGAWVSARYLLEALGSHIAFKVKRALKALSFNSSFGSICFLSLIAAAGLFLTACFGTWLLLPIYGSFYLLMASAKVLFDDAVQQEIKEEGRATVYSMTSLLENLSGIGLYGLFAGAAALSGLQAALTAFSIAILLLCAFFGKLHRALRKQV